MQQPTEKALTRDIRKLLKQHGGFFYKAWQGPMSASGVADLIGVFDGKPVAIEIKGPNGRLSPAQEKFLRRWKQAGGVSLVARDVKSVADELGILMLL